MSLLQPTYGYIGDEVFFLTGERQQLMDEAQERQRDVEVMGDRLAGVTNELGQSSSQVAALEQAVEAERASHIETKFSCELLQVNTSRVFHSYDEYAIFRK